MARHSAVGSICFVASCLAVWSACRAEKQELYKVQRYLNQREKWLNQAFPIEDHRLDPLIEQFALPAKDTTIRDARTKECKRQAAQTYKRHASRKLPETIANYCKAESKQPGQDVILMASSGKDIDSARKIIDSTNSNSPEHDYWFNIVVSQANQNLLVQARDLMKNYTNVRIMEQEKVEDVGLAAALQQRAVELKSAAAPKLPRGRELRLAYALFVSPTDPSWRIHRMMKALYHPDDFFFFHVDAQHLYQDDHDTELQSRIDQAVQAVTDALSFFMSKGNIKVEAIFDVSWGGVSMLNAELAMAEALLKMGDWDYIINLSSTDMPLKPRDFFVEFLAEQPVYGTNYMYGIAQTRDSVSKRGLENGFTECEGHSFRIQNNFRLLNATMIGGSSWFVLHRDFISWNVDCLGKGFDHSGVFSDACDVATRLLDYAQYKLSFEELYFQTTISLSPFCNLTNMKNDMRHLTWKREAGETDGCLHNEEVDWCGNSPRFLKESDYDQGVATKDRFFSRKYRDPSVFDHIDKTLGIDSAETLSESQRSHMEADRELSKSRLSTSDQNVLLGRAVAKSTSMQNQGFAPHFLVDGDLTTRWSSKFEDKENVTIEFATEDQPFCNISQIVVHWETAYATRYSVAVTDDLKTWRHVHSREPSRVKTRLQLKHTIDLADQAGQIKGLKVIMSQRATKWGYSVWEIEALGICPEIEGSPKSIVLGADQPM